MTIYELEKQATPGPLERHPCNIEPRNALTVRSADNRCYTVALVYDQKDAIRLQHCANNFLRALEALKNQVRMCDECGKSPATRWYLDTNPDQELYFCDNCKHYPTDGIAEENIALVKLIAELEEVK